MRVRACETGVRHSAAVACSCTAVVACSYCVSLHSCASFYCLRMGFFEATGLIPITLTNSFAAVFVSQPINSPRFCYFSNQRILQISKPLQN